eukprot:2977995-Ditylum_brightwellii.AAC.1
MIASKLIGSILEEYARPMNNKLLPDWNLYQIIRYNSVQTGYSITGQNYTRGTSDKVKVTTDSPPLPPIVPTTGYGTDTGADTFKKALGTSMELLDNSSFNVKDYKCI